MKLKYSNSENLLHGLKWGAFMHFLSGFYNMESMTPGEWNRIVEAFDVKSLARQLHEAGAGYFMLTIGQNSGFFCAPNRTYDAIVGYPKPHCSRRDLIADLALELEKYGIPLFAYLPANAPNRDPRAVRAFDYHDVRNCPDRLASFQRKWESVIREWSLRWGELVKGWWIDGCYPDINRIMYQHADTPNFGSFAAAMRAGNPRSLVAWNPGVADPELISAAAEEDYTAGECEWPGRVIALGQYEEQAQTHVLSYIGKWWGWREPRFSAETLIAATRNITDMGGAVTWDIPFEHDGTVPADFMALLGALGKAVNPTRGEPDRPPLALPRLMVNSLLPPKAVYPLRGGSGKIELRFRNTRGFPLEGQIGLSSPDLALAADRFPYRLAPGEECGFELEFKAPPTGNEGRLDICIGQVKRELIIPYRRQVRLDSSEQSFEFRLGDGRRIGTLVLNKPDPERLRFRLEARDELQRREFIRGSCLEIFGSALPHTRYERQLFAVPGKPHLLEQVDFQPVQRADTFLRSEWTDSGFRCEGELPLALLSGNRQPLLFDAALHTGIDGDYQYVTLFGSTDICASNKRYVMLV